MARRGGFEPPTPRFVVWCSIQLSYRRPCGPCERCRGESRRPRQRGGTPSERQAYSLEPPIASASSRFLTVIRALLDCSPPTPVAPTLRAARKRRCHHPGRPAGCRRDACRGAIPSAVPGGRRGPRPLSHEKGRRPDRSRRRPDGGRRRPAGGGAGQASAQFTSIGRSNRSAFMTFVQAATKSRANFAWLSRWP